MINFPSSPTLNQIHTEGGNSWQWNGYAWDSYNLNSTIVRTAVSGYYIYLGEAPTGSSEAATVWTITRIETNLAGEVVAILTAQPSGGVDWTNYSSHTYS